VSLGTVLACTIGVARGDVTADGRPLLWKNRDVSGIQCVMYDEGYAYSFIGICTVGDSLPWMGVNDAGFAILNALSSTCRALATARTMRLALRTCATRQDFEACWTARTPSGARPLQHGHHRRRRRGRDVRGGKHREYWIFDTADTEDGYVVRSNFSINGGGTSGIQKYERSLDLLEQFTSRDRPVRPRSAATSLPRLLDATATALPDPIRNTIRRLPLGLHPPPDTSICNNANGSPASSKAFWPGRSAEHHHHVVLARSSGHGHSGAMLAGIVPPSAISADNQLAHGHGFRQPAEPGVRLRADSGSTYIDTYKLDDGAGGGLWSSCSL
jgi:hypothetical protein